MKAIGIILAGGNNKRMKELSYNRAIAAMPMVGTYRSIDFALSNMSNSRIQKVAVLTQYNTVSLNEHRVLVISFSCKQNNVVAAFQGIERMISAHFL